MPNIAAVLREEISRLSRKEIRRQVAATKKATTRHRRDIVVLKRQVAQLERQVALLSRKVLDTPRAVSAASTATRQRFVAKGLRSQRKRLGLSAADYGKLLGVSAQSIYKLGARVGISAHRATFEAGGASWSREAPSGREIEAAAFREGPDPAQELAIEPSKEQLAALGRDLPFPNV